MSATERKERLEHLQHEANAPKSALMRLRNLLAETHPRHAARLETIIGKLEAWQHAK